MTLAKRSTNKARPWQRPAPTKVRKKRDLSPTPPRTREGSGARRSRATYPDLDVSGSANDVPPRPSRSVTRAQGRPEKGSSARVAKPAPRATGAAAKRSQAGRGRARGDVARSHPQAGASQARAGQTTGRAAANSGAARASEAASARLTGWTRRLFARGQALPAVRDNQGERVRFALTAASLVEAFPQTTRQLRSLARRGRALLDRVRSSPSK